MGFKSLLVVLIFLCVGYNSFAQIKWDVKAGLNYSNITANDKDGNTASTSSVPGIYVGLGTSFGLGQQFSLHPALGYAKRGFKQKGTSHVGWGNDFEAKVSYIELPLDLLYKPKIGPGHLLLGGGPYVGYGKGGKWTTSVTVLLGDIMIDGKGDIDFQNDNSYSRAMETHVYAKPWDYGLHFKIGYALFDRYALLFELQHGIADLQPRWSDFKPESTIRNKSFAISLGYSLFTP